MDLNKENLPYVRFGHVDGEHIQTDQIIINTNNNKDKIDKIANKVKNKELEVVEVNKVNKKKYSPALYDLTELQRDANKIYGYSAKETLSIMQKLYEHHKVLTYPRTDSRYLSSDIVDTLKDRIRAVNVSDYSKVCTKLLYFSCTCFL